MRTDPETTKLGIAVLAVLLLLAVIAISTVMDTEFHKRKHVNEETTTPQATEQKLIYPRASQITIIEPSAKPEETEVIEISEVSGESNGELAVSDEQNSDYTKEAEDTGSSQTDPFSRFTDYQNDILNKAFDQVLIESLAANESAIFENMPRYVIAMRRTGRMPDEAVEYVNSNLDYINPSELDWSEFYDYQEYDAPNTYNLLVLANKQNRLPSSYEPDDLVEIGDRYNTGANSLLRLEARDALREMSDAAVETGYPRFYAQSSYRSYDEQESIYNAYAASDGERAADSYSSRPGHSDHQTGLATDLTTGDGFIENFDTYGGYTWLMNHAHEYGFILRYPEGKEYITGYQHENWHFRYVGREAATAMHEFGWTLEEYLALIG